MRPRRAELLAEIKAAREGVKKRAATIPMEQSTGPIGSISGSAPKTRSPGPGVNMTGRPGPARS
jgi:hypothetical protein